MSLTHTWQIPVTWGDCDPAGIVFYPRYYAWFDASTHAMLAGAGLGHHALRETYGAIGATLVKTTAEYRSPATYDDTLTAVSTVARVGRSSFSVKHTLSIGDRRVVEGEEVRVWAVPDSKAPHGVAPAPIPPAVRAILTGEAPSA